jgi:hypothetical protein
MIERRRRGRGGRPSKGARHARTIRFPLPLNAAIEDAAEAAGYDNVNDYVVDLVAAAHTAGMRPTQEDSSQARLPIGA